MTEPREVLLEWAELPEVRRDRVPAALATSVTAEERTASLEFDGFRHSTVDYEWVYREPARPLAEQRSVRLAQAQQPAIDAPSRSMG